MKSLSIINKFLTILFLGIVLYFCNNDILMYLISIILITCLFNIRSFKVSIMIILVNLGKMFDLEVVNIDRIYYLIIMIGIICLMIKSLTILQKQYIFDRTIYKWKDIKLTRKHIYNCYYDRCYKDNAEKIGDYNKTINNKLLSNQIDIKTREDLNDIYVLYRIRFYQLYNRKRTTFPDKWKKLDTAYLLGISGLFLVFLYFK